MNKGNGREGGSEWDGLDRGLTVGVHLKVLEGREAKRRATQISVGKIGSAQIPSALFLSWPCFQFGVGQRTFRGATQARTHLSSTSHASPRPWPPPIFFFHIFFIYFIVEAVFPPWRLHAKLFFEHSHAVINSRLSRPHRSKPRLRRLKLVNKLWQHSLLRM